MRLDQIAAPIRPRTHWEAIDLGECLHRAWWWPIQRAWLATVLPVWIAVSLACFFLGRRFDWAMLLLWWLRPLFDRTPLFVASRALFGATPGLREVLRAWPGLWTGHALSALTIFRLDPARSFNLPVWQLEGLRGRARWKRADVLQAEGKEPARWLTFATVHIELALFLSIFGLVQLFKPDEVGLDWGELVGGLFDDRAPAWFFFLAIGALFVALSVAEPLYVVAGFALYMNRRSRLEGWDVEIAFRNLTRRIGRITATFPAVGRIPVLLLVLLLLGKGMALAQEPSGGEPRTPDATAEAASDEASDAVDDAEASAEEEPEAKVASPSPETIRQELRGILADPDFGAKKKIRFWRYKGERHRRTPTEPLPFVSLLAKGLELLLWIAVAILLGALLWWGARSWRRSTREEREQEAALPPVTAGADRRVDSIPDDPAGEAALLARTGRPVEALALLYRSALALLRQRESVPIGESWTEEECLRFLRGHLAPPRFAFFERLCRLWLRAAYAHREPDPREVGELCSGWQAAFGRGPA